MIINIFTFKKLKIFFFLKLTALIILIKDNIVIKSNETNINDKLKNDYI